MLNERISTTSIALIHEQCSFIRKSGGKISTEQLKESLDKFVLSLNDEHVEPHRDQFVEKYLLALMTLPERQKALTESHLTNHEFFIILRNEIVLRQFHRCHEQENTTNRSLVNASILFLNMCHRINENNFEQTKDLLFCSSMINEIARCLNEMATTGRHLSDWTLLRSLIHFLSAFKSFLRKQTLTNEYQLVSPILPATFECLCSTYIVEMIKRLKTNFTQRLDEGQLLFLDSLPLYLQWYSDNQNPENFRRAIRNLLGVYVQWLTNCQARAFLDSSSQMCYFVRHLSFFLIRPVEFDNMNVFGDEFCSDYCRLASFWSEVLSSTLDLSAEEIFSKPSIRTAIQNFYNLTLHSNVLKFIKTMENLIPTLLKMSEIEDEEIQIHSYRCLGKILTEDDIKRMANVERIASVYIGFLTMTIDDPKKFERFHSLLESLKNFIQHDQVKSELIKQNALPLLLKCVTQFESDPIKVQQVSLEILLGLSFDENFCEILKENETFLQYLRGLTGNQLLKRAAEGLLWKLEKEEIAVAQGDSTAFQYDLMISYSHRDENICFQIHDQLVADGFRVWIDRDCLRGSTMVGIANAIENSAHVLICMSNTYKQSVYCQSEANYAFERHCKLLPILVEPNYKPDGWLGFIVSGKIYVDFTKGDRHLAYAKLRTEIRPSTINDEVQRVTTEHSEQNFRPIVDLPGDLSQWNEDHVRSFFIQNRLNESFLPLCSNIDGFRLEILYEMCLNSRESMFQTLKHELNEKHHRIFPISDFLTFLQVTKTYVRSSSNSSMSNSSPLFSSVTICNLF